MLSQEEVCRPTVLPMHVMILRWMRSSKRESLLAASSSRVEGLAAICDTNKRPQDQQRDLGMDMTDHNETQSSKKSRSTGELQVPTLEPPMPETWVISQLEHYELEGLISYTERMIMEITDSDMNESMEDMKTKAAANNVNLKDVNFDLVPEPGPISIK